MLEHATIGYSYLQLLMKYVLREQLVVITTFVGSRNQNTLRCLLLRAWLDALLHAFVATGTLRLTVKS